MQEPREQGKKYFATWDLWQPVDEYDANRRVKNSLAAFMRTRAAEALRRENGREAVEFGTITASQGILIGKYAEGAKCKLCKRSLQYVRTVAETKERTVAVHPLNASPDRIVPGA